MIFLLHPEDIFERDKDIKAELPWRTGDNLKELTSPVTKDREGGKPDTLGRGEAVSPIQRK